MRLSWIGDWARTGRMFMEISCKLRRQLPLPGQQAALAIGRIAQARHTVPVPKIKGDNHPAKGGV